MAQPIAVGIVGLGRAGWGMHRSELLERTDKFSIVAACDPDAKRRRNMGDSCGCRVYASIKEMLRDPEVELVDIASRSPEHVAHAVLGLKANKDVFLEKPIALTYREAKKLVRAQATASGTLYLRHNRRFEPGFNHLREIMASGVLGEVYEIKLRRNRYQRRDDWQTLLSCGGGQLLNWGPHIIDHALQLLESPVADLWSDLKRVAAVGDAEDHIKIILRGENARVIDLEISGGAAISEPEYLVLGSLGALRSEGETFFLRYLDPEQKLARRRAKVRSPKLEAGFGGAEDLHWIEKTIPISPSVPCSLAGIWDHLYRAIREGVPFPVTLEQGLAVMEIISRVRKGTPFEHKR